MQLQCYWKQNQVLADVVQELSRSWASLNVLTKKNEGPTWIIVIKVLLWGWTCSISHARLDDILDKLRAKIYLT